MGAPGSDGVRSGLTSAASGAPVVRVPLIDTLRGFALLAMTIYHFAWDLSFFGYVPVSTIAGYGWTLFARAIASSFLFLVGLSLWLGHGQHVRWASFSKRLAMVAGAATAISLVTWVAVPGGFIFFGILHAIALFSLLALPFRRVPWWVVAAVAVAVIAIGQSATWDLARHPWLWWLGLNPDPPRSNDFVPLFPWFGAVLAGMATAKLAASTDVWSRLAEVRTRADRPFSFIGRRSLIYYLVHQPVLFAAIWTFGALTGGPDPTAAFHQGCRAQCEQTNDPAFCERYCGCVARAAKRDDVWFALNRGTMNERQNETVRMIVSACSADTTLFPGRN